MRLRRRAPDRARLHAVVAAAVGLLALLALAGAVAAAPIVTEVPSPAPGPTNTATTPKTTTTPAPTTTTPAPAADALPALPGAGQLPAASTCEGDHPAATDYCRLTTLCAQTHEGGTELDHRCDLLLDRENLRLCQATTDTNPACTEQTAKLKATCADGHGDPALCAELASGATGTGDGTAADGTAAGGCATPPIDGQDPNATCPSPGDSDLLGSNGGTSPWCNMKGLNPGEQQVCAGSGGSIAHPHPLSSYGLDWWIWNKVGNPIATLFQSLAALFWKWLMWSISSILLLLEWAFSLELTDQAMPDLEVALANLTNNVLGSPWMLSGIAAAGLWGIWNGLVRQQAIQTMGGLAMTVVLMVGSLYIIHDPRGTVGVTSHWINQSSIAVLAVATDGTVKNPVNAFADAQQKLFDATVEKPWCVLEFGGTAECEAKYDGKLPDPPCPKVTTMADAWLCFPANSSQRDTLYNQLKDKDHPKVELQEATGADTRLGAMLILGIGLLGAALLYGYLAVHLLLASTRVLLLTIAAPFVLPLPGFGTWGRDATVTYFKMGAGSIGSKFGYAAATGAVTLVTSILLSLKGLGFYPTWLLASSFWWGTYFRRGDIVRFATLGDHSEASAAGRAMSLFMGYRTVRDLGRDGAHVAHGVGHVALAPVRGGFHGLRALRHRHQDEAEAVSRDAQRQLEQDASDRVTQRHRDEDDRADHASRFHELGRTIERAQRRLESIRRDGSRAVDEHARLTARQRDLEAGGPAPNVAHIPLAERYHEAGRELRTAEGRGDAARRELQNARDERDRLRAEQAAAVANGDTHTPRYHANQERLDQLDRKVQNSRAQTAGYAHEVIKLSGERSTIEATMGGVPDRQYAQRSQKHAENAARMTQLTATILEHRREDVRVSGQIAHDGVSQRAEEASLGYEVPTQGWVNRVQGRARDAVGNAIVSGGEVRDELQEMAREVAAAPGNALLTGTRRLMDAAKGASYVDAELRERGLQDIDSDPDPVRRDAAAQDQQAARRLRLQRRPRPRRRMWRP